MMSEFNDSTLNVLMWQEQAVKVHIINVTFSKSKLIASYWYYDRYLVFIMAILFLIS